MKTTNDLNLHKAPDHGGGIDAAVTQYGGQRADWIDLSTGINPVGYPCDAQFPADAWTALPDQGAITRLEEAARGFWQVPVDAAVLAAPGASALIARIPALGPPGGVHVPGPTYNEHARSFLGSGWTLDHERPTAQVLVHPNNPDGRLWPDTDTDAAQLTIIDESFCDVMPGSSLIRLATKPGTLVLKSFGKFWGLAGLRLGFAIGDPELVRKLALMLGPWPVSGPALVIGAQALADRKWADETRERLSQDARRLDHLVPAKVVGGTSLFRLYEVGDACRWQSFLAQHHIWTRCFPYNENWLRLGLPGTASQWQRVAAALKGLA